MDFKANLNRFIKYRHGYVYTINHFLTASQNYIRLLTFGCYIYAYYVFASLRNYW